MNKVTKKYYIASRHKDDGYGQYTYNAESDCCLHDIHAESATLFDTKAEAQFIMDGYDKNPDWSFWVGEKYV